MSRYLPYWKLCTTESEFQAVYSSSSLSLIALREIISFRETLRDYKLPALSSLLSISTKYDFDGIRADVLESLGSIFPNELEKVGEANALWDPLLTNELCELLVTAHRCEAQSILPVLYYLCATSPIEELLEELHILPEKIMKSILRGRDKLCTLSQYLLVQTFNALREDGPYSETCGNAQCLEKLRAIMDERYPASYFVFVLDKENSGVLEDLSKEESGVCKNCASMYITASTDLKGRFWNKLPVFFMEKTWEELDGN